jgi:hypothetical protein
MRRCFTFCSKYVYLNISYELDFCTLSNEYTHKGIRTELINYGRTYYLSLAYYVRLGILCRLYMYTHVYAYLLTQLRILENLGLKALVDFDVRNGGCLLGA